MALSVSDPKRPSDYMIEGIISCQNDLIAALDARDADAVLVASRALATALEAMPEDDQPVDPERLAHGMKLSEAARIRVKYLTAWNRQKIDRLAEFRGQASSATYAPTLKP